MGFGSHGGPLHAAVPHTAAFVDEEVGHADVQVGVVDQVDEVRPAATPEGGGEALGASSASGAPRGAAAGGSGSW